MEEAWAGESSKINPVNATKTMPAKSMPPSVNAAKGMLAAEGPNLMSLLLSLLLRARTNSIAEGYCLKHLY